MDENNIHSRRKGIYLLPNLFTTAGLFAGFYAIVTAMRGAFDLAAIGIFVAMLMDTLDGRVARLTNTESAFGAEYDSLSDMVAFGIGPALVTYSWALNTLGKLGWLTAFLYVAAVALRLARFNTKLTNMDKRYFQGLPCTPAAGVIAGLVWIGQAYPLGMHWHYLLIALLVLCIAACMVSNIPYHSFKDLDLKGKVPFFVLLMIVLTFVCISLNPPIVLFLFFFGYTLSGPGLSLWHMRKKSRMRKQIQAVKSAGQSG